MLQKILLAAALVGGALPALAQSKERRRSVPPVRPQCVSSASSPMRTPCGYWLACRPTVRRSAQLVTRSWSATGNDELVPKDGHQFWGGARRLWRPARASLGVLETGRCGAVDTSKKYLERLSVCSIESLTWQEHVPPLDCQADLSPAVSPGGALHLEADRAAVLGGTNGLKSDFR